MSQSIDKIISIKTFIINLKSDIERRAYMEDIAISLKLDYEFVEAINGKEIDTSSQQLKVSSEFGRKLSAGEMGCLLSHQKIYSKIIDTNIEYALILEDDVSINAISIEAISCIPNMLGSFDVCLLGYHTFTNAKYSSIYCQYGIIQLDGIVNINYDIKPEATLEAKTQYYDIYKLRENGYGAYGYIVSEKGAKKLLEQSQNLAMPIDNFTGDVKKNEVFCIYPQIIRINENLSQKSSLVPERNKAIMDQKLLRYENEFNILIEKISDHTSESQIIIYGLNELGIRIYQYYQKQVVGIIDKKHAGKTIDSITVKSIEAIDKKGDFLFIITAINTMYITEMVATLNHFFEYPRYVALLEI